MKIKSLSAVMMLILSCSVLAAQKTEPTPKPAKSAQFETSYDKFKDETTVRSKRYAFVVSGPKVRGGLSFTAEFSFKGQHLSGSVDRAYLTFVSYSGSWVFLDDQHLIALVDGERIDLGNGHRDGSLFVLNRVQEVLLFDVSYAVLVKIANGTKVEMQLGPDEFPLKDSHLATLRDLASRMRQ